MHESSCTRQDERCSNTWWLVQNYAVLFIQGLAVTLWQRQAQRKAGSLSPPPWRVTWTRISVHLTAVHTDASLYRELFTVRRAREWEFRKLQKFESKRKRFSVWLSEWFTSGIFLPLHVFTKFHFLPDLISSKNAVEFPRCTNLSGYPGNSFRCFYLHLYQVVIGMNWPLLFLALPLNILYCSPAKG